MTDPAHAALVDALRASLDACGPVESARLPNGLYAGDNLPERLRAALDELAVERGGPYELVAHRPGSWEAQHVLSLSGFAAQTHFTREQASFALARAQAYFDEQHGGSCDNCGDPMVTITNQSGRFCSPSCADAYDLK